MDINSFIRKAIIAGKKTGDIIKDVMADYGLTYNAAQKRVRKTRTKMGVVDSPSEKKNVTPAPARTEQVAINDPDTYQDGVNPQSQTLEENGTKMFTDIIKGCAVGNMTEEDIMKAHGLSTLSWRVTSWTTNFWNSTKDGELITLCQSKLKVRPLAPSEYTFEDIDRWFAERNYKALPAPTYKVKWNKKGATVEIVVPDIHIGLLAWRHETGEDYDLNIAKSLYLHALDNVMAKIKNIAVKEIVFVTIGDLLHVDNDVQTTTKGTFQQVDGRLPKIIDYACDMMEYSVEKLAGIAPLKYIYIAGNHDRTLGYTVAKTVEAYFRNYSTVSFDISPNPHKYMRIGKALVGWTHGDMNKKNLENLLYTIASDNASGAKVKVLHVGHLHSAQSFTSGNGTYVEYLDSLCPASYWEHQQGYGKTDERYLNAFVWDGTGTPPDVLRGSTVN